MSFYKNLLNRLENLSKIGDWQSMMLECANTVLKFNSDKKGEFLVFGSRELDSALEKAGSIATNALNIKQPQSKPSEKIIYLATELYSTGGHTRAINDIIRSQPQKEHLILLTNLHERFNKNEIEKSVAHIFSTDAEIQVAPEGFGNKFLWIIKILQEINPEKLFLFNHHYDSIAVAAAIKGFAQEIFYYHHCDHNLALGVFLKNAHHVDCSNININICKNYLGIKNPKYWPLTAEDKGARENFSFLKTGELITCSHGGEQKFSNFGNFNYFEGIIKRLKARSGIHEHIGPLSELTKEAFMTAIRNAQIEPSRVKIIGPVPDLWNYLKSSNIDLVIASFPEHGGRGAVETMGVGMPMLVHDSSISPLLSSKNFVYQGAYGWSDWEDFVRVIRDVQVNDLESHQISSRNHYLEWHQPQELNYALSHIKKNVESPPMQSHYTDTFALFVR